MKKIVLVSSICLSSLLALTACGDATPSPLPDGDKVTGVLPGPTDDPVIGKPNPDAPDEDWDGVYTYQPIKSMKGSIAGGLELFTIPLPLINSDIVIDYQEAEQAFELQKVFSYAKFHISFDLYKNQNSFEGGLLLPIILPLLAPDFAYVEIQDNLSNMDLYYNGDGVLFTSIYCYDKTNLPDRNNPEELRNAKKILIGTTKLDLAMLVQDLLAGFDFDNLSLTILDGLTIDLGKIGSFLEGIVISFKNGGFTLSFNDSTLDVINELLSEVMTDLMASAGMGALVDLIKDVITFDDIALSIDNDGFKFHVSSIASEDNLLQVAINDTITTSTSLMPDYDLNKSYATQNDLMKLVNKTISLNQNISFDETYQKDKNTLISSLNNLKPEEKLRIRNFTSYNYDYFIYDEDRAQIIDLKGYKDLLEIKDNIILLLPKTKEELEKLTAFNYLTIIETFNKVTKSNNNYSHESYLNLIKVLDENNSSSYALFKDGLTGFGLPHISKIDNEFKTLIENYTNVPSTLQTRLELIKKLDNLINNLYLEDNGKYTSVIKETSNYVNLSYSALYHIITILKFENLTLQSSQHISKISEVIGNLYKLINTEIEKISIKYTYSNINSLTAILADEKLNEAYPLDLLNKLKLFGNEELINKNLEFHTKLVNSTFKKFIEESNAFFIGKIHQVITKEGINELFTINKINRKLIQLEEIYKEINDYMKTNPLIKRNSGQYNVVEVYSELKELLEYRLSLFSD